MTSRILGGWQISGATFMRTGTPLWVTRGDDTAGVGDTFPQPWNQVGDPSNGANGQFSQGTSDQNLFFNPTAFAKPAAGTFGNAPRDGIYNPGQYQWDIALFKNVAVQRYPERAVPGGVLQFHQPPELERRRRRDPTNSTFGRVTSKDNSVRDIQLSLRYMF